MKLLSPLDAYEDSDKIVYHSLYGEKSLYDKCSFCGVNSSKTSTVLLLSWKDEV